MLLIRDDFSWLVNDLFISPRRCHSCFVKSFHPPAPPQVPQWLARQAAQGGRMQNAPWRRQARASGCSCYAQWSKMVKSYDFRLSWITASKKCRVDWLHATHCRVLGSFVCFGHRTLQQASARDCQRLQNPQIPRAIFLHRSHNINNSFQQLSTGFLDFKALLVWQLQCWQRGDVLVYLRIFQTM